MRLLWKHLFRSNCRAPLQPFLICLTVLLSVVLTVTTASLSFWLSDYTHQNAQKKQELGDILITAKGNSKSRFLFPEDAEELLGSDGKVVGEFKLTGFIGENRQLLLSATDLVRADEFYAFRYLAYDTFTTQNLATSAILSESTAKEYGLTLGDELPLRILGKDFSFTVRAIAEDKGILHESNMLISLEGVRSTLAEQNPAIASLGDSFTPYTRLNVSVNDGVNVEEILSRFTASEAFASQNPQQNEPVVSVDFWITVQVLFLWIFLTLTLILSIFLIGTAQTLLHQQRSDEYALFSTIGVSPRQLAVALWTESGAYTLLGTAGGIALAIPITRLAGRLYNFQTQPPNVTALTGSIGALISVSLMAGCTALHLKKRKQSRQNRSPAPKKRFLLLLTGILGILLAAIAILPQAYRYIPSLLSVLVFTCLIFFATPSLFQRSAKALLHTEKKRKSPSAIRFMAFKHINQEFALHHVGRLLAVMLALLLSITVCERVFAEYETLVTDGIQSDISARQVRNTTANSIQNLEEVKGSAHLYYHSGIQLPDGTTGVAVSIEGDTSQDILLHKSLPDPLPKGKEVVLSPGIAYLANVSVGDSLPLTIDGITETFTVSQINNDHANFIYIDSEAIGIKRDIYMLALTEDAKGDPKTLETISNILESEGALLISSDKIFGTAPKNFSGHLIFMRITLSVSVLLGLIGLLNMLVHRHRCSAIERQNLISCGMSRWTFARAYALELTVLGLLSLPIILASATVICVLLDIALRSFGMVLFT